MKTAMSIPPNLGLASSLERRIKRLKSKTVDDVIGEILTDLIEKGYLTIEPQLTQDASLTNPTLKEDRAKLNKILKRISNTIADQNGAAIEVESFVRKNLAKWFGNVNRESRKIAEWFVRNSIAQTTVAQRRSLTKAGVSPEVFKRTWRVPILRGQMMSAECALLMPKMVDEITGLITNLSQEEVGRLQDVITVGVKEGQDLQLLKDTLSTFKGFDKKRVQMVSIDQTCKVSFAIQKENDKSLGIRKGIWIHVAGKYTSRETHKCPHTQRTKKGFRGLNGAEFDLDKGIYDESVGRYVLPSSEIYCFPSDSRIDYCPPIAKLYRRFYSGELTEIITDDGEVLRTTPNHPILTSSGFVRAGNLDVGNYLVKASRKDFDGFKLNENWENPSIGEIFGSFSLIGSLKPFVSSFPTGKFDGDIVNGEVDVIDVEGFLSDSLDSETAEFLIEKVFSVSNVFEDSGVFTGDSLLSEDVFGLLCTETSGMSVFNERLSLLGGKFSHPYVVSLATVAALHAILNEKGFNRSPVSSVFLSDFEFGHTAKVVRDYLVRKWRQMVVGGGKSVPLAPSSVSGTDETIFGTSCLSRCSFGDFLKRIAEVRSVKFSDHVYNIETLSGWYICNSTTVHNCRCEFKAVLPDYLKEFQ